MTTDTEIRSAFHSRLDVPLSDVTISPALLGEVRRRHRRERQIVAVGAPLAVAALVAGAVVGVHAVHSASSDNARLPVAARTHVPTILGHPFRLPAGWTRQSDGPVFHSVYHGKTRGSDQEWGAMSPDAQQSVYLIAESRSLATAGRLADSLGPHATPISVDGLAGYIVVANRGDRFPVEAGVTLANGDYLDITAQGMTASELERFLDAALRP